MESRFRTRISRLFSSSLGSCGSKNLSGKIKKAVILPQSKKDLTMTESLSPKCPEKEFHSGHEVEEFIQFHEHFDIPKNEKHAKKTCPLKSFSQPQDTNFHGWFSSEDEAEAFFSSKSGSSTTSEPRRSRTHRRKRVSRQKRAARISGKGSDISVHEKVKDSFAFVKQSSDPYNDFRTSMVEMIVEKQIVGAEDLEQLLQCFLSLNSDCYHRIIIEVFIEICEILVHN